MALTDGRPCGRAGASCVRVNMAMPVRCWWIVFNRMHARCRRTARFKVFEIFRVTDAPWFGHTPYCGKSRRIIGDCN